MRGAVYTPFHDSYAPFNRNECVVLLRARHGTILRFEKLNKREMMVKKCCVRTQLFDTSQK